MIIILLLVNLSLLGSLVMRKTTEHRSQQQAKEQLMELFNTDGIALEEDAISSKSPPPSLSLSRNREQEQAIAAYFLGEDTTTVDQGGGTYSYVSSRGKARFRSNGAFEITGTLAESEVESVCEKFCKTFSYQDPIFSMDDTGSGTATAACNYGKVSVFNAPVTFTLENEVLTQVSGILLPSGGLPIAEAQKPLSASAALIFFQNMRRKTFAVVSEVTGMYPCYELQNTTASSLTLVPAWCILTDTVNYYVNAITGNVTSH